MIIFIYRNTSYHSHCYHELWNTQCIDQQCRHTQRYQPTNQPRQQPTPFTHFDCPMLTAPFGGKVGIKTTFGRVANRRRHHQRTSPRCVPRRDDVRTATEQAQLHYQTSHTLPLSAVRGTQVSGAHATVRQQKPHATRTRARGTMPASHQPCKQHTTSQNSTQLNLHAGCTHGRTWVVTANISATTGC